MESEIIEQLTQAASVALKRELNQKQIQELALIHEGYLAYRDSREPYVSDQRFLSKGEYCEFYRKLRNRAQKLLASLQDRENVFRKAPAYRQLLIKMVFPNAIKEVEQLVRLSDMEIKMQEMMNDPEKLLAYLNSDKVRFVPRTDRLPLEIIKSIRQRKRRKGGPIPDSLLDSYILKMADWYKQVTGKNPGKGAGPFLRLIKACRPLVEKESEDVTINRLLTALKRGS